MSRRARALGFAAAAAACAGLAAVAAGGAAPPAETQFGELREVVVATEALPGRSRLREEKLREALEVRRVPARFLPPDALTDPAQALGRTPATTIPPGSYLLGSQLRAPAGERAPPRRLGGGRRPVEIAVDAPGSLAAQPSGRRIVDVVVTTEPGAGGAGRTYVAAEAVELLGLGTAAGEVGAEALPGPATGAWTATLALTRDQALRLIQAESFARGVRLIER